MNGEDIKEAIKSIVIVKEQTTSAIKKRQSEELDKTLEPFSFAIKALREQCPHVWEESWAHPHNGDQYYDCKFCGSSKR